MAARDDGAWVFAGHGEMARRCAHFDWSATPLGPIARWPQSLRTAASLALASGSPRIVLWGPELVQIYNDGYIPFLGHRHPGGLGVPARECWPEAWARTEPIYARVADGETVTLEDQRFQLRRTPDAPLDDFVVTLGHVPVRGERGTVDGVFINVLDPSDERRGREALTIAEAARAEAEAANQAKAEFLSTMSHELRTPLNAIQGYAQLIELGLRGPVSSAMRDDLGRIRHASQHLITLITDILDFTRLEAARVEYHIETVDLSAIIGEVEAMMRAQITGRAIRYLSTECAYCVRADAEKVRQILVNLLSNAVKFTAQGGRVSIECEHDHETREVLVRVRDEGRGIADDKLESIFEPFVQLDRHLLPASQLGVGLGLAISRDLAHGMGCTVSVESRLGEGSVFTLALPAAPHTG